MVQRIWRRCYLWTYKFIDRYIFDHCSARPYRIIIDDEKEKERLAKKLGIDKSKVVYRRPIIEKESFFGY